MYSLFKIVQMDCLKSEIIKNSLVVNTCERIENKLHTLPGNPAGLAMDLASDMTASAIITRRKMFSIDAMLL